MDNLPTSNTALASDNDSFELIYSEIAILSKLQANQLKPSMVLSTIAVNQNKLATISLTEKIQVNSFLFQLEHALQIWPIKQTVSSFVSDINHLLFLWLNAMQDGASAETICHFLQCFELKPLLGLSQTKKFHCFLFALLAESSQAQQIRQLDYAINFDANTRLPNANQIFDGIEHIAKLANNEQLIGLFSIQFQISKNNPIFSQIIALSLSKKIASLLKMNLNDEHQLFYSGNLQFDILISSLTSDIQLNLLAAKIGRIFENILFLGNQSVLVTPFVGCAFVKKSSQHTHDLYGNAKLALESAIAKQQHFVLYSNELQQQLITQNDIENKVLEAFSSDSFTLYFQPIINIKNNKIAGAELLLRWSDQSSAGIYPSLTIEILNKVGKGKLFTRWLINSACRYASELIYDHKMAIYLTINLRAEDLYDIELPHLLLQAIALWQIKPQDIVLEITENGILELNDVSKSVINELSIGGFRLALDDFGTGFSSLSRLRTMPIDLIKIDQTFVRDITHSPQDYEIVKSIAMLANSLGKEVLAEGVEDADCLALIKKMKIHKCQGYFFAKPMPFEQFIPWALLHK